jgi:hypothetical protein
MLFFVQDFAYFGKTHDLVVLHDVPLAPTDIQGWDVETMANHFLVYPEQYIWYHYFLKSGRPCLAHAWDKNAQTVEESRRFYCEKTIPLSFTQFGIDIQKYPTWVTHLYRPKSVNWMLRGSLEEWKLWIGRSESGDEVSKKNHWHGLYLRFLREKVGQEQPLHFEINVAIDHVERGFDEWLKNTAAY